MAVITDNTGQAIVSAIDNVAVGITDTTGQAIVDALDNFSDAALEQKQNTLIAGTGVNLYNDIISLPFAFGVTDQGEYGYIKNGTNEVIPFTVNNFKEFTMNVNSSNSYSTGTIHIGSVTTPGSVSCGWTSSARTNYIQFTTTATELLLYGIMTFQVNSSYTNTFSVTGCNYEILDTNKLPSESGGRWAKMRLYNISPNTTITLNCYTSYSAISGIGYIIYGARYD